MKITQLDRSLLIDGLNLLERAQDLTHYGPLIHLLKNELDKRAIISFDISKDNLIAYTKLFEIENEFMVSVEAVYVERAHKFIKDNNTISSVSVECKIDNRRFTSVVQVTSHSIVVNVMSMTGQSASYDLTSLFRV